MQREKQLADIATEGRAKQACIRAVPLLQRIKPIPSAEPTIKSEPVPEQQAVIVSQQQELQRISSQLQVSEPLLTDAQAKALPAAVVSFLGVSHLNTETNLQAGEAQHEAGSVRTYQPALL